MINTNELRKIGSDLLDEFPFRGEKIINAADEIDALKEKNKKLIIQRDSARRIAVLLRDRIVFEDIPDWLKR